MVFDCDVKGQGLDEGRESLREVNLTIDKVQWLLHLKNKVYDKI